MPSEIVELEGHIIDSLTLAKALDAVLAAGANYELLDVSVGRTNEDESRALIRVEAMSDQELEKILGALQHFGANRTDAVDAAFVPTDRVGVLPQGFYATTNLRTSVRVNGRWLAVENPEMDCALVLSPNGSIRTKPMHAVGEGERVVVGHHGVRVEALSRPRGVSPFEFMNSEVSPEKPKSLLVARVAERIVQAKANGAKMLVVCGPAVVHTGAAPDLARLIREGWVDVLFSGNGFATHDIESNVLGTSLGISLREGSPTEGGHANHLRVINEIRRHGSIKAAVDAGYLSSGVMYEAIVNEIAFVLAGSLRDDGPLPDVITDVVVAADAMRAQVQGVGVALILASMLHAIATGNILPSWVETYCVDINPAAVTKLSDRGSHQTLGIVTDVGLFLSQLTQQLCTSTP